MTSTRPVGTERGELDILTSLRFVAAIGVVLHHVGVDASGFSTSVTSIVSAILHNGRLGVQFFFTLSGFILAYVYSARDTVQWRSFIVARVARVYPVYLLALVVGMPMLAANIAEHVAKYGLMLGWGVSAVKAGAVLLLLQAWMPSVALFWNGVSWSLSAEAFFYACFPRILDWVRKRSGVVLIALLGGLLVFEILRTVWAETFPNLLWGFMPAMRIHEFVSGVVVCVLYLRGFSPGWKIGSLSALLLVACVVVPGGDSVIEVSRTIGTHVGFCLLIPALAISRPAKSKAKRWMVPLVFLGQISYAVYLLHFPLLTIWEKAYSPAYQHPVSFLGVLLLVSAATYVWVEEPARRRIRGYLDTKRA